MNLLRVSETLPLTSREVLGGVPTLPCFRGANTALVGRRQDFWADARLSRGIPMLWGSTFPAFARWMVASPAAQPSRLRTFPGFLGKRGKEGLQIQMRRQKRGVQVALHRPNATGTHMPAERERLLDVGTTAMARVREPGALGGDARAAHAARARRRSRRRIARNIPGARSPTLRPNCCGLARYEICSVMIVFPTATISWTRRPCRLLRWAASLRSRVALRRRVARYRLLCFHLKRCLPPFLMRPRAS